MLDRMAKNRDVIEDDINLMVYHMQGAVDYDDAWLLTQEQRLKLAIMLKKLLTDTSHDL